MAEASLRSPRILGRLGLVVAGLLAGAAGAAAACEAPSNFTVRERLATKDLVVMFRTVPATIEVGRHFTVEAIVCATPPTQTLRVDAQMPEHRHGMNYRATVAATGPGRYLASGLLFHMPGRWQLLFDVERGGRTERLAADILLE